MNGLKSIPLCPILTPTYSQFQNFDKFVEKVEQQYSKNYGMVKIIPPPQWQSRCKRYNKILDNLQITTAEYQSLFGEEGKFYFECKGRKHNKMTLDQYKKIAALKEKEISNKKNQAEIQNAFWKIVHTLKDQLYCVNVPITLMDSKSGSWEFGKLKSLFSETVTDSKPGLNSSYLFIGAWRTIFNWHVEDIDLSAINLLHEGATKMWYSVHPEDRGLFQSVVQSLFQGKKNECSNFLRHKENYINPYQLKKMCPKLRISKMYQNANQISLAFSDGYHCGFNMGFNIAEAVNYATTSWLHKINHLKECDCEKDLASEFDVISAVQNLQKSEYFEKIKNKKFFKELKKSANCEQKIIDNQDAEFGKASDKEIEKEVMKEKSKKINKLKNQVYVFKYGRLFSLDNYLQCCKCKVWKMVNQKDAKKLISSKFYCKMINQKCEKKKQAKIKHQK